MKGLIMKHQFASRFRTLLPLAVALSLVTSLFSFAPSASAAAPTIALVSPSSGTTAGGTTLTITGNDFQTAPGFKVIFDGVDSFTYANWTNTSFTLITPPHAAGTVVIHVHTDLGDPTATYTYVTPFHVTYLNNGSTSGTPPTDPNPYMSGDLVTVLGGGTLVKTGYLFGGWQDCVINHVYGSTFTITGNTDLCPLWTANSITYTVTYIGNGYTGGLVPVDSTLYSPGISVTVRPLGTLVRAGYIFAGWDNGKLTVYQPNQSFIISSNTTLTALWTASKYTVTYNGNGNTDGVVPLDSKLYSPGSVVTVLPLGSLVKTGYTFSGWMKDGLTIYLPHRVFIISSNTTLTAAWTASSSYTITYSGNGNTGGTAPSPTVGSGLVTLATNTGTLVKTGYTFNGWNTYANGLGTLRAVGSTYTLNADVTLYAIFVPVAVLKNVPDLILDGRIIVTAPPKKIALNQIVPVHQQFLTKLPANVVGFELYENGKFLVSAKSNNVFLKQIVGPKDQVTVIAVGKDGTKSAPSPVALSKDAISLANINFNTDSYKFIGIATKILDQVAAVMIQHGYTHLDIYGYVDTQGSKASWITLSNNRAKAVNDYMAIKLFATGITIRNAGRAQTQAVGNNSSAAGRALNRRVEIRVS